MVFVVAFVILPAAKEDANPLASEGAHDGVVFVAASFLLGIVGPRPGGMADRLAGVFMEALAQKFRTAVTAMNWLVGFGLARSLDPATAI